MKTILSVILAVVVIVSSSLVFMENSPAAEARILVLSENNTISINSPITASSVTVVQRELMEKDLNLPRNVPLYLILNSPGGSVDAGIRLIDTAKGLGRPIHTVSMFSASMSFIISQYLGTRYVLKSSTLMSHRAFLGGIQGFIPGSFLARTNAVLSQVQDISSDIAKRAKMSMELYQTLIANELWMTGEQAIRLGFADKLVRINCDKTLQGYGKEQTLSFFGSDFKILFPKCPLVTEPKVLSGDASIIRMLTTDKKEFVNLYGNLLEK